MKDEMTNPTALPRSVGTAERKDTTNTNAPKSQRTGLIGITIRFHQCKERDIIGLAIIPSTGVSGMRSAEILPLNRQGEKISQRPPEPERNLSADSAERKGIVEETATRWRIYFKSVTRPMRTGGEPLTRNL
jgi:hypothetical protein